jgi:hypothetical protein
MGSGRKGARRFLMMYDPYRNLNRRFCRNCGRCLDCGGCSPMFDPYQPKVYCSYDNILNKNVFNKFYTDSLSEEISKIDKSIAKALEEKSLDKDIEY